MYGQKPNKANSRSNQGGIYFRSNQQIKAREVRVVNHATDEQHGVLKIQDARNLARQMGLDLIEVAPNAEPPVCKLEKLGKFKYELEKHAKDKAKSHHRTKEIKLHPNIEQHDFDTKLRHAKEFLEKGHSLKISLQFRGREIAHKDLGMETVTRMVDALEILGQANTPPKAAGKTILAFLNPKSVKKTHTQAQKLK